MPKTEAYCDDIVVHGQTLSECKADLKACLTQLQQYDLHLKASKCKFLTEQIEFLGHVIQTIKCKTSKVKAIIEMPQPQCTEDVRRFLGMVTYYARFSPNASTITTPLRFCFCRKMCNSSGLIIVKELSAHSKLLVIEC